MRVRHQNRPAGTHAFKDACWTPDLLGSSRAARHTRQLVFQTSGMSDNVLIVAEQGLNAEAVAREFHARGGHPAAPFNGIDCAGRDPNHVELDLLGVVPARTAGRPETLEAIGSDSRVAMSRGGTLFLANVGELPASTQARLARMARDGEMRVYGSGQPVPFDVRLVASTMSAIEQDVEEGRFRSDLFGRLGVVRLEIPPLRRRGEDIPCIVERLTDDLCRAAGAPIKTFTDAALALLASLPWRGNTHELRGVLEHLVLVEPEAPVRVEDVLAHVRLETEAVPIRPNGSLREARRQFEREYIAAVIWHHGWRMGDAAKALGIQRTNLHRKMKQLGIRRLKLAGTRQTRE